MNEILPPLAAEPATPASADEVAEALTQLRDHQRQIDQDGAFVGVSRQALDIAMEGLLGQVSVITDELTQLNDRALRMEAMLRLIRIKVMGDLVDPESGALRDWMRDWIDGFKNGVVEHGPIGGPMLWPASMPGTCRQLMLWGFSPIDGPHGIKYTVLKRAPEAGEGVQ